MVSVKVFGPISILSINCNSIGKIHLPNICTCIFMISSLYIGVKGRTNFLNFNLGTYLPSHVRGDPWMNFFFQKSSLIIFETLSNDCIWYITWGHNTRYFCARSVHGLYNVHSSCTVHIIYKLYTFSESA